MNTLVFNGSWHAAACFLLALAAAAAVLVFYRRETRHNRHALAKALPWLRACSVFLLVLMLSSPTLRQTRTLGSPSKLSVFVDCSQSMGTADREMETVRKLALARNLQWLDSPSELTSSGTVAELLSTACRLTRSALNTPQIDDELLRKTSTAFLSQLTAARKHAEDGSFSAAELKAVDQTLLTPLGQFAARKQRTPAPMASPPKEFMALLDAADRWQRTATQKVEAAAITQAGGARKVAAALERVSEASRLERVRAMLLDGGREGMLSRLAKNFDIELLGLTDAGVRLLWRSADALDASACVFPGPESTSTNIGSAILERLTGASSHSKTAPATSAGQSRSAAILFTDGRHNAQGSPVDAAKRLMDAGVPLYCIGVGSSVRPADLAISDVEAPGTVFFEDRVSGWITIKDDITPGQPFEVDITSAGKTLWKKSMTTSQQGPLKVPFDFEIKGLVSASLANSHARHSVVPLACKASVTVLPQEHEPRNNTSDFLVRATTVKRRLLLLDGRPRWETRYIRNLYERDPQWTVNCLLVDAPGAPPMQRGTVPGSFPSEATLLDEYDMVILGDLANGILSDAELTWLCNFVTKRGGGLLLLDGQRHELAGYAQTPLSELLPVAFPQNGRGDSEAVAEALLLTDSGRRTAALKLDADAQNPDETWSGLPAPRRLSRAIPLPGSDVLIEAQTSSGRLPALVTRRQGAGNVAYMAFDESWRWRTGVAGKFQERFWSQLVNSIADPVFASSNDEISLDTDAFRYAPGATALIRARTKKSRPEDAIKGSVWRNGVKVGSLDLVADPSRKGVFTGKTAPLEAGVYDFGLDEARGASGADLKIRFEVQSEEKGELAELTLDETLLNQMADASHGHYLREENAKALFELLHPLETGQVVTWETPLAQGYPWFCVVILLLSIEWMLRKRVGLV
jgi:uncharacterized membrane protein